MRRVNSKSAGRTMPYVILKSIRGPVAQLGARFHGMEEVVSSNLTRSTKFLKHLPTRATQNVVAGVQMESKFGRQPQIGARRSKKFSSS
jgi:hypothetical protein